MGIIEIKVNHGSWEITGIKVNHRDHGESQGSWGNHKYQGESQRSWGITGIKVNHRDLGESQRSR